MGRAEALRRAMLARIDHGEDHRVHRDLWAPFVVVGGVVVDEARLTHLAYAPEIAQAMLRRQQAEAVIAARQKIVHGAVSMVDMALKELAEKHVVQLDDERRAAMVRPETVVGWHRRALEMCGARSVRVVEDECRAKGGAVCRYKLSWD